MLLYEPYLIPFAYLYIKALRIANMQTKIKLTVLHWHLTVYNPKDNKKMFLTKFVIEKAKFDYFEGFFCKFFVFIFNTRSIEIPAILKMCDVCILNGVSRNSNFFLQRMLLYDKPPTRIKKRNLVSNKKAPFEHAAFLLPNLLTLSCASQE